MRRVLPAVLCIAAALCAVLCAVTVCGISAQALTMEADFYLNTFEQRSVGSFFNAEDGCSYDVIIPEAAYNDFIRVEYDVVRLLGIDDEIVPGEQNEVTGHEYISRHTTVSKSGLTLYPENKRSTKSYAYFTVTAHEWSAFVFTVYYDGPDGETAAYGSQVLLCTNIDNSCPEAFYEPGDWVYDSGEYVFTIKVLGTKRSDKLSAKSGLSAFTVKKDGVKIDEVTDITGDEYRYRLRVPTSKAVYTMDIIDRVGNGSIIKIVEFTDNSYDSAFESACNIVINDIEDGVYEDFSEELLSSYQKAYEEYYLLVQPEVKDEEKIQQAMDVIYALAARLYELKQMKQRGEKEITVLSPNAEEYFGSDLVVKNGAEAYPDQKYGEKMTYTLSVAELNPKTASRSSARQAAGITDATTLYSFTVYAALDGEELKTSFDAPLKVRIPQELSVIAVQTADDVSRVLTVTRGNGYTEISVPRSYGRVDIFVDAKKDYTYLWALTAIPAAAGIATAIILIVKKKKKNKKISDNAEKNEE